MYTSRMTRRALSRVGLLILAILVVALAGCHVIFGYSSQGTKTNPVDIGDATAGAVTYDKGEVGPDAHSYYVATVASNTEYTVTASEIKNDILIEAFAAEGFVDVLAVSDGGSVDQVISFTTGSDADKVYIKAKSWLSDGSTFTLTVE